MSPRSSEQFEKMRQESRKKIMNAALELFAHKGYHTTSINKIAKEAGISKGLIYNYFDSKEQLLKSLFGDLLQQGDDVIYGHQEMEPVAQVKTMVMESFEMVKSGNKEWRLATSIMVQPDVMQLLEDFSVQAADVRLKYMEELFKNMGHKNPDVSARGLSALLDGIGLAYLLLGDSYPLERMKWHVIHTYCKTY